MMLRSSLALLVALVAVGCDRPDRYHTRGLVQDVGKSDDLLSVAVHHERIDAFRDRDGKTAPMGSMTMVFGAASSQLAPPPVRGDKVAFDFEVRWDERPALRIVRIEKLPADTALRLTSDD